MERMGQDVLSIQQLTHGYQDRTLFKNCDFEMEKAERVVLIGEPHLCCIVVPPQGNVAACCLHFEAGCSCGI